MKKLFFSGLIYLVAFNGFAMGLGTNPTISVNIQPLESTPVNKKLLQDGMVDSLKNQLKTIKLLNLNVSNKELKALKARVRRYSQNNAGSFKTTSVKHKQLEMPGIPVLDQGEHGTCVMFAVTTAINAATHKQNDEQISQLCQLQLGSYLANNSFSLSGWDGSFADKTLDMLENYGYLTFGEQKNNGCGGDVNYPMHTLPNGTMTLEDYWGKKPNPLEVLWGPILSRKDVFADKDKPEQALMHIKELIDAEMFVTSGVMLFAPDIMGTVGATAKYKKHNDTWILSPSVVHHALRENGKAGHEMVIIGYDDNACVTDERQNPHCGLVIFRNSWGENVGDNGNFYMSYDYFKTAVIEAHFYIDLSALFGE